MGGFDEKQVLHADDERVAGDDRVVRRLGSALVDRHHVVGLRHAGDVAAAQLAVHGY